MKFILLIIATLSLLSFSEPKGNVIDFHAHIDSSADKQNPKNIENLLRSMRKFGIVKAVVISDGYAATEKAEAVVENNFVAMVGSKNLELIPFCGVNLEEIWAVEEVSRCATELGIKGIKLHPQNSNTELRNEKNLKKLEAVVAEAAKHKMIVLIDSAWMDSAVTYRMLRITMKNPEATFVFAHMFFTHFRDMFFLASMYELYPNQLPKNIYLDISATIPQFLFHPEKDLLLWHMRKFGIDKIFFASDSPIVGHERTLESLKHYDFSTSEREMILHENAEKLFAKFNL